MTLVIWRYSKPNKRRHPGLREVYEEIAAKSAQKLGREIAEIRATSHATTKKNDAWIEMQHHMTMNWFHKSTGTSSSEGIASSTRSGKQGHCFVDGAHATRMLRSWEIDEHTKAVDASAEDVGQNPHTWSMTPPEGEERYRRPTRKTKAPPSSIAVRFEDFKAKSIARMLCLRVDALCGLARVS